MKIKMTIPIEPLAPIVEALVIIGWNHIMVTPFM
jgi:hypothetical protein